MGIQEPYSSTMQKVNEPQENIETKVAEASCLSMIEKGRVNLVGKILTNITKEKSKTSNNAL